MSVLKRIIGYGIALSFVLFMIYGYYTMVRDDGWWRGLIIPTLSIIGLLSLAALSIYLIFSSNKKR